VLSNAVKYSTRDPNSPVDFRVERQGDQWIFEIRDYGIGIASEDQPLLFNAFHRGKNVADVPGTGLGLAIAQRAIELHGGTLTLDSALDQGTTITIALPAVATNPRIN
jgi:signal transduction histidine kinase